MRHKPIQIVHCPEICLGEMFIEEWHRLKLPATSVRFKLTSYGLQHDPETVTITYSVLPIENRNKKLKIIMYEGAVNSLVNLAKCFLCPLVG